MSREYVLLSESPIEEQTWAMAAGNLVGSGSATRFLGGLTELCTDDDDQLISFWESRHLVEHRDADVELQKDTGRWTYWTDVTIPFGQPAGERIMSAVAAHVGAVVVERS